MNKILSEEIENTFLTTIKDVNNLKLVLADLLGDDYLKTVKKLAIVYWLRKNRPKDIIKNNLEVTDKEIKEVEKIMDKKGMKLAIKYMEAEEFANVWSEKIKNITKK